MSECESMLSYGELGETTGCVTAPSERDEPLTTPPPSDMEPSVSQGECDFPFPLPGPSLPQEPFIPQEPRLVLPPTPLDENEGKDSVEGEANGIASPNEKCDEEEEEEEEEDDSMKRESESDESKVKGIGESAASDLKEEKKEIPEDNQMPDKPGAVIRMRSIVDLLGTNGVKEEKVEDSFAALNVLVNNIKSSPTHASQNSFDAITTINSQMPSVGNNSNSGVPNLPPGVQISVQKRPPPSPFPSGVTVTKQARRDSESSSCSSLSPAATPPPRLPDGITLVKPGAPRPPSSDPVTNLLATRGVSVMPSRGGNDAPNSVGAVSIRRAAPQTASGQSSLLNNSALTITATPPKRSKGGSVTTTAVVDLTDDALPAMRRPMAPGPPAPMRPSGPRMPGMMGRGRAPAHTCDICDKAFANAEALRTHMMTHNMRKVGGVMAPTMAGPRGPAPRQPLGSPYAAKGGVFECQLCTARYQSQQQLMAHTQRFHPDKFGGSPGTQFALPVVDLMDSRTLNNLFHLGIKFCIPLASLEQAGGGGSYGLPIVPLDGAVNPAVSNLDQLNCSNLLPLGPMKGINRRQ